MRHFSEIYARMRRKNQKQYVLLVGCCFFSVLLITAYVCMMRAPTVLNVLPEGGDSRKQVMMIFTLAVLGCAVFTTYASGLFLRQKSRETGVFLALGASRAQVRRELYRELGVISLGSCAAGAVLGGPLAWILWQFFRLCVVDTEEMRLVFDPHAYLWSLAFSAFVIVMMFFLGSRSVKRTNIMDIVQESHKSESIRDVPRWYGPVGIVLLALGILMGYLVPAFFVSSLHWYAPGWVDAVFYLPALAGLYMILLHTVVNGWNGKKKLYKDLIATSQMRFQGRQTVRNMLVMTLLIAGAYFGSFYTPMLGTGSMIGYDIRPVDYVYNFRADQDIPLEDEVRALAEEHGVTVTDFAAVPMIRLAVDGWNYIEEEGPMGVTWRKEYEEVVSSDLFLSASGYEALTGVRVDLAPGEICGVIDVEGSKLGFDPEKNLVTNYLTGEQMPAVSLEPLRYDSLFGRYVLNDADFARLGEDLPDQWRETQVCFNVENCEETYEFAKALFNEIVDRSTQDVAQFSGWDPVVRDRYIAEQGVYFLDPESCAEAGFIPIDYDQRDSSAFRLDWQYMPEFRVLDKVDFVRTMAVFLILFIFIAVVCFAAVFVIAYTRCMTIALTNAKVYDDLRHLGASNAYLRRSVRGQVKRVFLVPALVGTGLIYAFYVIILYFNGRPLGITPSEAAGLLAALGVVAAVSVLMYAVYRLTLRQVCVLLSIHRNRPTKGA
ncbi:MAG: FtsX-like permease family protein [Oscillibacter sp.]|nr:FtsX-like permease family protein [Oscillibacter sp.]